MYQCFRLCFEKTSCASGRGLPSFVKDYYECDVALRGYHRICRRLPCGTASFYCSAFRLFRERYYDGGGVVSLPKQEERRKSVLYAKCFRV